MVANARDDVMWVEQRTEGDWKVVTYDHSGDGNAVERLLDDRGLPTGEPLGTYPYTPSSRPWYRTAAEAGEKGAWSPLYVWATTDETPPIGAGFAREITNENGRRLALIEIGFTTRDLSEQMGRKIGYHHIFLGLYRILKIILPVERPSIPLSDA